MTAGLGQDGEVPVEIRRGNNDPAVIWEFLNADGTAANLNGSVFELVIGWPATSNARQAGMIVHSSDKNIDKSDSALAVDASSGRVTWPYTLEENAQIPDNKGPFLPRYVLRCTIDGKVRDWASGPVLVRSYLP